MSARQGDHGRNLANLQPRIERARRGAANGVDTVAECPEQDLPFGILAEARHLIAGQAVSLRSGHHALARETRQSTGSRSKPDVAVRVICDALDALPAALRRGEAQSDFVTSDLPERAFTRPHPETPVFGRMQT